MNNRVVAFLTVVLALGAAAGADAEEDWKLVVQLGHSSRNTCAAFSPDGKYAVTGSADTSLILWHLATGIQMRAFRGHAMAITSVCFSPDGKYILSGSDDYLVKLWEVETGNEVRTFEGHAGPVQCARFSPDGRRAASGGGQPDKGELLLWDVARGRMIRSFAGQMREVCSVRFSADGRYILSAHGWGARKKWDLESGKEILSHDLTGLYADGMFSPDGRFTFATGGDRPSSDRMDTEQIFLVDLATGERIRSFEGYSYSIGALSFSPDGRHVLASVTRGLKEQKSHLVFFDVASGKELRRFTGDRVYAHSIAFSPDGAFAVTTSDSSASLWDISTGRRIRNLEGQSAALDSAAFTADGKSAVAGGGADVRLLDLTLGRESKRLEGHSGWASGISISPDGKMAASVGEIRNGQEEAILLWDLSKGNLLRIMGLPDGWQRPQSSCFSPDGKNLLVGDSAQIGVWDVETGRYVHTYSVSGSGYEEYVTSICFSPDGKTFLAGCDLTLLQLREARTGECIRTFSSLRKEPIRCRSACFSPDGRYALSGGNHQLFMWNVATGTLDAAFYEDHIYGTTAVGYSPDGALAVSGTWQMAELWDVKAAKRLRSFDLNGFIVSAGFQPDGRHVLSASTDSTVRVWDLDGSGYVAFVSARASDDWLVYTHDGYWDASRDGGNLVAMVRGMEVRRIDQFAVRNNRPDIILHRLGCQDSARIEFYHQQYRKRLKRLGFTDRSGNPDESRLGDDKRVPETTITAARQDGKFVELRFQLVDAAHELKRYSVHVDDVPLYGSLGRPLSGRRAEIKERIELTSGQNKIEVSCLNAAGAESYRALVYVPWEGKAAQDLYYLGFGVSEYRSDDINDLEYAAQDAKDLADYFARNPGGSYAKVFCKTYTDSEVSVQAIAGAKRFLAQSKPDDTLVLFVSGHGTYEVDAQGATYYYLGHEADPNNLAATASPFEVIEELLQGVAPRNKLFLLDTCASGEWNGSLAEAEAGGQGRGVRARVVVRQGGRAKASGARAASLGPDYLLERDRFIENDLSRRSGSIVFSSCTGEQVSWEAPEYENGVFTEFILRALQGAGDADRDRLVSTEELCEFVRAGVAEETSKPEYWLVQTPVVDRDNIYRRFALPSLVK